MTPLEEAQHKLDMLVLEYNALKKEIPRARARVQELETRRRELQADWNIYSGLIPRAREELKDLQLQENDKTARRVKWSIEPSWGFSKAEVYVVDKVTAKRIYTRKAGRPLKKYFNKESGKGTSKYDGIIDINATFPEGIDNYGKG